MKASKIFKRLFLTIFILVALLIGALIAIPYFFKDEIVAVVKEEINKNVNAEVDFVDVDMSLIRSFPDFSLDLQKLTVKGKEEFEGTTLADIGSLGVTLDVMSVINSDTRPIEIKSVNLDQPKLHVVVLSNGKANYDIALASETPEETTETPPMQISLQEYAITDGEIIYDDKLGDMFLEINNLDHSGEGDFTLDIFDLQTETEIEAMTFIMEGIPYLKKAKANLDAGFNIDMPNSKYTLKENNLTLNAMQMSADGWVAMPGEDIDMDLKFNAPQNNFKNLLSLVPNAYTAGYEDVKANGNFVLNGFAKGVYGANPERYPAFQVNLDIDNGDIKYPDLPLGISDIFTKIKINSPSSDLDKMVVDISKFNLKLGSNPFGGHFKLKTPMSDPDLDTKIKGVLNLSEIAKAVPMEGVNELSGKIDADVLVKTKMSTIDKEDYENVTMQGSLQAENLKYVAEDMPPVLITDLNTEFSPKAVVVNNFDSKLGKSDLRANGRLDNLLAYFSPEKTMTGNFVVRSNYFDANEWMTEEEAPATTPAATPAAEETEIFDRFAFDIDAEMKKVDYDIYDIKNVVAKGKLSPNELKISNFGTEIGNSDIRGNGNITNVFNYVFENETLGGKLNLKSKFFDLNQFMVETEEAAAAPPTSEEELEPILVPDNIDMTINADFDKVRYTNMDLDKISGTLLVANEAVEIQNMTSQTLGGKLNMSGGYDTKDNDKPKFDLVYDLVNLDFAKAFTTLNSFEALAPVGNFINGRMSSKLKMSSELGKDFMPDLATLFADGFLHTFDAKIKNFPPLEAIANKLNVDELKAVAIKSSKNWFKVEDGTVSVQPFDYDVKDIAMNIAGGYQLAGGMDFKIVAKVPRELLQKNGIGAAANSGLDFLSKEAGKLGFNLDAGEFINVQFNLTGEMTDPKVGMKLLGTSGKNESLKDAVAASIKEEAKAKIDEAKDEAKAKAQTEIDKAKAEAEAEAKKIADKAKKEAEEKLRKEAEEAKKKLADEAAKKAAEEAQKLLDEKAKEEGKKLLDEVGGGIFGKKKKKKENGGN